MGKAVDEPPNVKPCCAGNCKSLQASGDSSSDSPKTLPQSLSILGPKPIRGHRDKTKNDVGVIAKAKRLADKRSHAKRSTNPMDGSKRSKWKRQYNRLTKRFEAVRREK